VEGRFVVTFRVLSTSSLRIRSTALRFAFAMPLNFPMRLCYFVIIMDFQLIIHMEIVRTRVKVVESITAFFDIRRCHVAASILV